MAGMNGSISTAWYTFTNLGPVTTTFTPEPSCTEPAGFGLGYLDPTRGYLISQFSAQCTSLLHQSDCVPPATTPAITPTASSGEEHEEYERSSIIYRFQGAYYSPGIYCPSGWETIGMVGRDSSGSLTSSGILAPTPTTTYSSIEDRIDDLLTPFDWDSPEDGMYNSVDYYYYLLNYKKVASLMTYALEPQQTMAVCCPRFMTADDKNRCYSLVTTSTPAFGCGIDTGVHYDYSEVLTTSIFLGETRTSRYLTPTATIVHTYTYTTTLDPPQASFTSYTPFAYAPMITLVHHESDLASATAVSDTALSADLSTTALPTTGEHRVHSGHIGHGIGGSNAAGRLSVPGSVGDGIGVLAGSLLAGMMLGAAMVWSW